MSEAGRASSSFSGSLFILTTLTGDIQFRMSQSVSYYTHSSTVLTCVLQKEPVLRQIRKKQKKLHFDHSKQHMTVCGLSSHLGGSESRKTLEQKFIFQIGTLNPHGINERFSFN